MVNLTILAYISFVLMTRWFVEHSGRLMEDSVEFHQVSPLAKRIIAAAALATSSLVSPWKLIV